MGDDSPDKELHAIASIIKAVSTLTDHERERVFYYILTRFGVSTENLLGEKQIQSSFGSTAQFNASRITPPRERVKDIRTLAEEKKPRSANEMAALVAYYLQYEANEAERKETIGKADLERYFHLAKFKKPKDAAFTLVNSRNAGYLDSRERGTYSLNPVGYNLVVHKMPRKAD